MARIYTDKIESAISSCETLSSSSVPIRVIRGLHLFVLTWLYLYCSGLSPVSCNVWLLKL